MADELTPERLAEMYFRHKETERQIAIAYRYGERLCARILETENGKLWRTLERGLFPTRPQQGR